MNKKKQIEEMAKEIHKALLDCKNESCCNCEFNNDSPMSFCKAEYIAKTISKKYQPKLPEDSVVLTREEYELLTSDLDKHDYGEFESGYSQGSKETAREILSTIGNMLDDCDDRFKLKDYQWHRNMCKKYGVDIGERK